PTPGGSACRSAGEAARAPTADRASLAPLVPARRSGDLGAHRAPGRGRHGCDPAGSLAHAPVTVPWREGIPSLPVRSGRGARWYDSLMCGRYGYTAEPLDLTRRFDVEGTLPALQFHFNVAPTQTMPVVVAQSPNRVELMRWGLIPRWAKEPDTGLSTINARA